MEIEEKKSNDSVNLMWLKKAYKFINPGLFPLSIALFLTAFLLLYRVFGLPSPHRLVLYITEWFQKYGLWLLFISAFLESVFIIGMYFPGSLAIALAVYTLGKSPLDLFYIGGIAFVSFLIGNIFNYYLGKYGYYKVLLLIGGREAIDKMKISMSKNAFRTFLLTGFFPNFIAITSVCAGITRLKIINALGYLVVSLLFWVTVWTIVGSLIISKINIEDNDQSVYLLGLIIFWALFVIIKENYFSNRAFKK